MSSVSFEKLRVYQLAEELAETLWLIVRHWDRFASDTIGKQLIRAADSVGANIAEGFGRGTFNDNRRFVRIARGSLYEARHWLRQAFRRNLLSPSEVEQLKSIVDKLGPQLNAYLKSIGPKNPTTPSRPSPPRPNDE
jgi:four helix bundle protein